MRRLDDAIGDRRHFDRRNCARLPMQIEVVRANALILSIDHALASLDGSIIRLASASSGCIFVFTTRLLVCPVGLRVHSSRLGTVPATA